MASPAPVSAARYGFDPVRRLHHRHLITAAVVLAGSALLWIAPYALMMMAPALALAWLVALGRFTGETAVAWVRRVAARLRSRRPRAASAPRRRTPLVGPRPGLLMAAALASRPPPVR